MKHSLADLTLVGKVLGYKPIVSFPAGLEPTVRWYEQNAVKAGIAG